MYYFSYKDGQLYVEDLLVLVIVEEVGMLFYCYLSVIIE